MRSFLLALCAVTTLSACPSRDIAPPADALTDADAVVDLARSWLATAPATALLEGRASQYNDHGALKGKVLILIQRPDSLHLSALSPTDDMLSVLTTDGDRFTSYERGSKTCFVGRACPSNVGRFTSIPLASADLTGALLGRPSIIPYRTASVAWDSRLGAYRLDLTGDGQDLGAALKRRQLLWVAPADGRILKVRLIDAANTQVEIHYSSFKHIGNSLVPRRLDIQMSQAHTDLRIDYRDIILDEPLDAAAFAFACPSGTTLEELACLE